jgi:hypothetical protein
MAGFDKVDPANLCVVCGRNLCAFTRRTAHGARAIPIENCCCLSRMRKLQRPESTPHAGNPEW